MKTCCRCTINKSLDSFHKRSRASDGRQSICKTCRKELDAKSYKDDPKVREKLKTIRAKVVSSNQKLTRRLRKLVGCLTCGERCHHVLEFHHLNPKEKDKAISALVSCSRKTLVAEIRKCVILCANCHRKYHAGVLTLLI